MKTVQCGRPAKARILIIEDQMAVAMMMVFLLTRASFDVSVAHTGEKGLVLALETKFDLIVLDTDLFPSINELDVYSELKQRHFTRHTPVVFVSERSSLEDQQRGFDVGAADYITKPFDTSDFVQRILACAKKRKNTTGIIEGAKT